VWHDLFIRVPWLIHTCDLTCLSVRREPFICNVEKQCTRGSTNSQNSDTRNRTRSRFLLRERNVEKRLDASPRFAYDYERLDLFMNDLTCLWMTWLVCATWRSNEEDLSFSLSYTPTHTHTHTYTHTHTHTLSLSLSRSPSLSRVLSLLPPPPPPPSSFSQIDVTNNLLFSEKALFGASRIW